MDLSQVLGVVSSLIYCIGYLCYNLGIFKGTTSANKATWGIWSSIAVVNMGSYIKATRDLWKSLIPILDLLLCALTLVIALVKGRNEGLDKWDKRALWVGCLSVIVWAIFKSATWANVVVQVSIAFALIPTWRAVWQKPEKENSLPWLLWSASYALAIVVVILRWSGKSIDLVYPINGLILHLSVPVLAYIRRRNQVENP